MIGNTHTHTRAHSRKWTRVTAICFKRGHPFSHFTFLSKLRILSFLLSSSSLSLDYCSIYSTYSTNYVYANDDDMCVYTLYMHRYIICISMCICIYVYTNNSRTPLFRPTQHTRFILCRLVRVASMRSTGCSSEKFSRFSPEIHTQCGNNAEIVRSCSCGIVIS